MAVRIQDEDGEFALDTTALNVGEALFEAGVDEIVAYGTRIVLRSVDTPEGPREYWRVLRMYATSYYPAELGGDSTTSIGETLRKGIVASDPHHPLPDQRVRAGLWAGADG